MCFCEFLFKWTNKLFSFEILKCSNYAILRTLNDELWTNVSKYDDNDWLLTLSCCYNHIYLRKTRYSYDKSSYVKKYLLYFFFFWHFNKLNPPMYEYIWHLLIHKRIFYYGMQNSNSVYLHNNSWNSNLILRSKQNSQYKRDVFVLHFVFFVTDIYIVRRGTYYLSV